MDNFTLTSCIPSRPLLAIIADYVTYVGKAEQEKIASIYDLFRLAIALDNCRDPLITDRISGIIRLPFYAQHALSTFAEEVSVRSAALRVLKKTLSHVTQGAVIQEESCADFFIPPFFYEKSVKKLRQVVQQAPNAVDFQGASLLMQRISQGDQLSVIEKIIAAKASIDQQDSFGVTALMRACGREDGKALANALLIAKATVSLTNAKGETALFYAAYTSAATVALLLKHNADLHACSIEGRTPLFLAVQKGKMGAVKLLVQAKANLNSSSKKGMTALDTALLHQHPRIACYLLQSKASVQSDNPQGISPLIYSAAQPPSRGYEEVVRTLLTLNAPINAVCKDGTTAVMNASAIGNLLVVQMLVEAKADVQLTTPTGKTAVSLAKERGMSAVSAYLAQLTKKRKLDV